MVEDYSKFRIKRYRLWDLFLHVHQTQFMGRAYAWARREDAVRLGNMTRQERDQLDIIIPPEYDQETE